MQAHGVVLILNDYHIVNFLVTGAGGYIGRHLLSHLAGAGHQTSAYYRYACPTLSTDMKANVRLVQADLQTPLEKDEPVDVVVHAATVHPYSRKAPNAIDYLNCNVNASRNVADLAKNCSARMLIYLSTVTIHGQVEVPELTEITPRVQPDLLGQTKYLAEQVLATYSEDMAVVVLRLPGVVGPQIMELGRPWLCGVLRKAQVSEPISVYCADSLFNNIIDVDEIARFILGIPDGVRSGLKTFNFAASIPVPLVEVIEQIIRLTESRSKVVNREAPSMSYFINTARLVAEMGFTPMSTEDITNRFISSNLK